MPFATYAVPVVLSGEGTTGNISAITGALPTLTTVVNSIFDMIVGNPLLVVFAAAGLLYVGIRIWRRLRRAAG